MKSLARPLPAHPARRARARQPCLPAGVFRGNYCSSPDDKIIEDPRQSRDRFEFSKAGSDVIKKSIVVLMAKIAKALGVSIEELIK